MMKKQTYTVLYPRKRFTRGVIRGVGRLILPLFFRLRVQGREHFPRKGPLIVVGNHTAVMEAVLMAVYTPWQVEMLAASDIPSERITTWAMEAFGAIPINRGHVDRAALRGALDVLEQEGIVGIFPEGGFWQGSQKRAQPGVAWLSYRGSAPVLPIGFGDMTGALNAGLRFERPELKMIVGKPIPPAVVPTGTPRRAYFESYAEGVMDAVRALIPEGDRPSTPEIVDERFELQIEALNGSDQSVALPSDLMVDHSVALAKVLHRPGILKIFRQNLQLPIDALQNLHERPAPSSLVTGLEAILAYLEHENPYLLTYRFGPREGAAMQRGFEDLLAAARWAEAHGNLLHVTPIRRYYVPDRDEAVTQIEQGEFAHWM